MAEILRHVDSISEVRRERRVMADGVVPAIIRVVLFGGTILTVGFTFIFGAEHLRAQSLMTGALSVRRTYGSENLRQRCKKTFGIDPARTLSTRGLQL
ncbi:MULTISPECIES: bestrophin-like domain [Bradyrhizobium]|uniref:bestrophin-like domain n=1 Tax=Bradyrhizobium elkanii TaxID=29448 RepID=UPI00048785D6|nr:hypothetical protein [Bradyrhizobium elkanii]